MKRTTTLTFQYYRLLLYHNIFFTVMCALFFLLGLKTINLPVIIISKFVGFIGAAAYHYYMQGNSYFYFRNAGLSIRRLYMYAFVTDLAVSFTLSLSYILFTHAAAYFKG